MNGVGGANNPLGISDFCYNSAKAVYFTSKFTCKTALISAIAAYSIDTFSYFSTGRYGEVSSFNLWDRLNICSATPPTSPSLFFGCLKTIDNWIHKIPLPSSAILFPSRAGQVVSLLCLDKQAVLKKTLGMNNNMLELFIGSFFILLISFVYYHVAFGVYSPHNSQRVEVIPVDNEFELSPPTSFEAIKTPSLNKTNSISPTAVSECRLTPSEYGSDSEIENTLKVVD